MSQEAEEARKRMQVKSFTTWVNLHLKKCGLEVTELKKDFADGISLLKLIETISEESLGKHNKKPISKFQKVENLNLPLQYINAFNKQQGISNQYSAENILEENELMILGMVWTLILRFAVQEISEGDRTAKEGLLLWAQKKVEEASKGKVTVTNFHTSWQDGTAFCTLIQAFRPDLIDYAAVRKSDDPATMEKTLNMAFDTAYEKLEIPKMLDAKDMVSHRPDEKSVMTYVTFFWKEFASTKKKLNAAERISKVVERELYYEEMQSKYVARASALSDWLQSAKGAFAEGPGNKEVTELQKTLDDYVEYGRTERPAKIQEHMEVEALFASINSRLMALGGRKYEPPECSLRILQEQWDELTKAEQAYEDGIKLKLTSVKRIGGLAKIFHSKANKLDAWLATKAAWVQAAHEPCLTQLGKPPAELVATPSSKPAGEFGRLTDPTLAPTNLSPSPGGRKRATTSAAAVRAASMSTPPPLEKPKAKEEGDEPGQPVKRSSFFGDLFAAIQDNFGGSKDDAASLEVVAEIEASGESTPTVRSASVLKTKRSVILFADELAEQKIRQGEEVGLDSISAVQAKLNLLKAYEEEQSGRQLTLGNLQKVFEQLTEAGCPQIGDFEKRKEDLSNALSSLSAAAAAYREDLQLVLKTHQDLDERRLAMAKRAEALNRWIEESTDAMSEVMAIETMREADAIEAELATFNTEYASQREEWTALDALSTELAASGPNPYSRFRTGDLDEGLQEALKAADERAARLAVEREKIAALDATKKQFAQAADDVLAFIRSEKAALESATPPMSIHPDDAESIAAGKKATSWLEEYTAKASERADHLAQSQALAEELFQAGEMDNPYTRQSIASLKGAVDQLEKMVRDKQSLIQGQLDRATYTVSPAQHAELESAFAHFDKTGDRKLNKVEFGAAVKSMDFEGDLEEEFGKYVDTTGTNAETGAAEETISFDNFLNLMLAQFKDKDTNEGLVTAFRTLANGKETLPTEELEKWMTKPAELSYLQRAFTQVGDGYDYPFFCKAIYGGPTDVS